MQVVLGLPSKGVAVVFVVIVASARTSVEFRIYVDPFACGVFWPHESLIGSVKISVVEGLFAVICCLFRFVQLPCHLGEGPVVVTVCQGDGDTLAAFEVVYLFDGFCLSGPEGRIESFFAVETVEDAFRSVAPGKHGGRCGIFQHSFVSFWCIEVAYSLAVAIQ